MGPAALLAMGAVALMGVFMANTVAVAPGEIRQLADNRPLTGEGLMAELAPRRVVLVGESHDNPHHHQVQLAVIRALHAQGPGLAVGMEMFHREQQPLLDAWSAGTLSEEAFLDGVEWYFTWGFDAALYLPILRYLRDAGIPLLALNVRRELVGKVRREGLSALTPEERRLIPDLAPASPAYRGRLAEVFGQHPMMARMGRFDHFVEAQRTWDGVMAGAITQWLAAHPGGRVVGVVGAGHLVYGHGIPHQLAHQGVDDVAVVLPVTAGEERLERALGDYLWGTEPPPETPPPVRLGVELAEPGATPAADGGSTTRESISAASAPAGVLVAQVGHHTPAAEGGMMAGDRIISLDGQPVRSRHQLVRLLRQRQWGETLTVGIVRENSPLERIIPLIQRENPHHPQR